jgi:hypothetical protein
MIINFTFVGGCFPVQHNIEYEKLFHQIVKKEIENRFKCELNVNIIRYERFLTCLNKIKSYKKENQIDILIFHIRSEPFLRLSKLYYKYVNEEGKLCRSFNLPYFKIINPEKYDYLVLGRQFATNKIPNETLFHKILIDLNYFFGFLILNLNYALKSYLKLTKQIIKFSEEEKINLILLGPASRPHTRIENKLSAKLNRFITTAIDINKTKYLNGLGTYSNNNEPYFIKNGIHATEAYHQRIAEDIINEFSKILTK